MPQKTKKNKNSKSQNDEKQTRLMIYKTEDHEYGLVTKKLGNGRFTIKLNITNAEVIGRLCGKLRKHRSVNNVDVDSIVLVGLRDYEDKVTDIVHVYNTEEIKILKKEGEYMEETGVSRENKIEETTFDFDSI
jgi:initiation factor 1A